MPSLSDNPIPARTHKREPSGSVAPADWEGAGPRLTIVIPAFNEAENLGAVLDGIRSLSLPFLKEVIVVDDGSRDDTGRIATEQGARMLRHPSNCGYGASIKTGVRAATTEFILTMDAEGQHRPEDVPRLWAQAAEFDMVVGNRFRTFHSPLWRMPGKWLLGIMANYLSHQKIPDLNSGLRLIRREQALKYLHVCPQGFSLSTTITMIMHNRGHHVGYVPVEVDKRLGKSTVSLSTGLDTLILLLRVVALFNPLRVFIPLSLSAFLIGVGWGIPFALGGHGVSVGSMLAIVTAVFLFGLGMVCDQISHLRLERFE